MTIENISRSIYTKVWDQARIEHAIPGSAVGLPTDCATESGKPLPIILYKNIMLSSYLFHPFEIILSYCPASVTVMSWLVFKVIRDLESIDPLCINPIHRIGLIHK